MENKNSNKMGRSLLAVLLSTSSQIPHVMAQPLNESLTQKNPTISENEKFIVNIFKVNQFVQYTHESKGSIQGHVFLKIFPSKHKPLFPSKNEPNLIAEYEGLFYFESDSEYDGRKIVRSLGGDDGAVILDLKSEYSSNSIFKSSYLVHSCSSSLNSCDPMSLKAYFLKNGQIQIKGNIDSKFKVEKNGQWSRIEEFVLNQIN